MKTRISMVVQHIAFISLMILPWTWLLIKVLAGQISLWDFLVIGGIWLVSGVGASLWHRNMVAK